MQKSDSDYLTRLIFTHWQGCG